MGVVSAHLYAALWFLTLFYIITAEVGLTLFRRVKQTVLKMPVATASRSSGHYLNWVRHCQVELT